MMGHKGKQEVSGEVEVIMQHLSKNYISLHNDDVATYRDHFQKVMSKLLNFMKEKDALFNATYQELCGAGSFYDGLKVGKPTEFDMDIIIKLPIPYKDIIIENQNVPPAFVKVQISKAMDLLRQHPRWTSDYRMMDDWRDKDNYLLQTKFRQWMEAVVNKALNELPLVGSNSRELVVTLQRGPWDSPGHDREVRYLIALKKSGPAMTLQITIPDLDDQRIDVDMVPVIEFKHPHWPPEPVRPLPPTEKGKTERVAWFIVPKPKIKEGFQDTHWRLAFHHQEREMIRRKGALKPVCRLLKKVRDVLNFPVASYYIKTVFLWEVQEQKDPAFWNQRVIVLLLHMLKKLAESVKLCRIDYYWDKRYNLLEGLNEAQTTPFCNKLLRVVKDIERALNTGPENSPRVDPYQIVKHFLNKCEWTEYKNNNLWFSKNGLESRDSSEDRLQIQGPRREGARGQGQEGPEQEGPGQEGPQGPELPSEMMLILLHIRAEVADSKRLIKQLGDKVTALEANVSDLTCKNIELIEELKLARVFRRCVQDDKLWKLGCGCDKS